MKKLLIIVAALLGAMSLLACEVSTANLTNVRICNNAVDNGGDCSEDMTAFKTTDPVIYLSANLENAPDGTVVTATWNYVKGEYSNEKQEIDKVSATATDGGNLPFHASLTGPTDGWPKGDYEVIVSLSSDNSTPITKPFSIK